MSGTCYYLDSDGLNCDRKAEWEISHYERAGNLDIEEEILEPEDICEFTTQACNLHVGEMLERNYINVVKHMIAEVDIGTHLNGTLPAESLN